MNIEHDFLAIRPALTFARTPEGARPLHVATPDEVDAVLSGLPGMQAAWAREMGFAGTAGEVVVLPGAGGEAAAALLGRGTAGACKRTRFGIAAAVGKLPAGAWTLTGRLSREEAEEAALGWLLEGYRFDRYASNPAPRARLICPEGLDPARLEALARGEALSRDLINMPASDMGPDELEMAMRQLSTRHGADLHVIAGADLLAQNFPMIHAVGRAASRCPRLLELHWGNEGPSVTLVGKGVCFDTGGLNLKPGKPMGLMKKDMGGAATVLGLAHIIMTLGLKLRLRVLVPAVENAVSGNAFRPGDILTSRKGLTVEVNNTDAEGRLVLADALAFADEAKPDLIVCMATLTGAARVALGPDLPPFYTDDEPLAAALISGAESAFDPVWRMPLWPPYESGIEPGIADLDNAPSDGMAGSITAALFLRRFVTHSARFAHFDIYGWQPVAAPGRPKGGVGQGARAILAALDTVFA